MSTTPQVERGLPDAEAAVEAPSRTRSRTQVAGDETWDLIIRAQRHRTTGLSSQFAYNAFIATVPLLLTLIAAVRLLAGTGASNRIVTTYNEEIPAAYQSALHDLLESALRDQNRAWVVLGLGAIGALYLAGNAVGALMVGLDHARGRPDRPWIVGKMVGIELAAIWIILATAVNIAILLGQHAESRVSHDWGLSTNVHNILQGLVFFVGTLILLAMVWVLYRDGPNAPVRARRAYVPGMVVASVGIVAFSQLFAGYVDVFGGFSVYGALLGVVIYLTFLWGVGFAVLIGAEINESWVRRQAGGAAPPRRALRGR